MGDGTGLRCAAQRSSGRPRARDSGRGEPALLRSGSAVPRSRPRPALPTAPGRWLRAGGMGSPEGPSPRQAPAGLPPRSAGGSARLRPGRGGARPPAAGPRTSAAGSERGSAGRAAAGEGAAGPEGGPRTRSASSAALQPGTGGGLPVPGSVGVEPGRRQRAHGLPEASRGWGLPALPCNCTKPPGSASPASSRSVMQLHLRTGCRGALLCAICRVSETSTSSWTAVRAPQLCPASVCVVGSVA